MRFQRFDSLLAQLKAFINFEGKSIEDYGITEPDYEEYAAHYRNVIEELRNDRDNGDGDDDELDNSDVINTDYELLAYSHVRIDYDYIISLIQNIVSAMDDDEENEDIRQKKLSVINQFPWKILLSFRKYHAQNNRKGIRKNIVKNAGKNMGWCSAAKTVCD